MNAKGTEAEGGFPTPRRATRQVRVGSVLIGGGAPVVVQTMTKTDTRDVAATVAQIRRAHAVGCELVRVAVPDEQAAEALREIVRESPLPVVADIHFDYRLALLAIDAGAAKVRINPGNIGGREKLRAVVRAAQERGVALRVGVNSGSLERELREKYGGATAEAMVESALRAVGQVEELGFSDIVVSLKASDVARTVQACRLFAERSDCPQHLGVTEAGLPPAGTVRSAVALGILLGEGIGDTMRVSLTAPPEEEVRAGWEILRAVGLRTRGPVIVSCPTCARCEIDLVALAEAVRERVEEISAPLHLAVMGCAVNGPGEAREADVAICGGKGCGVVVRRGEIVGRFAEGELLEAFLAEVRAAARELEEGGRR